MGFGLHDFIDGGTKYKILFYRFIGGGYNTDSYILLPYNLQIDEKARFYRMVSFVPVRYPDPVNDPQHMNFENNSQWGAVLMRSPQLGKVTIKIESISPVTKFKYDDPPPFVLDWYKYAPYGSARLTCSINTDWVDYQSFDFNTSFVTEAVNISYKGRNPSTGLLMK